MDNWPWIRDLGVAEKLCKGEESSFVKDCEFEEFSWKFKGEFQLISSSYDL